MQGQLSNVFIFREGGQQARTGRMLVDAEINTQSCLRMIHLARWTRANEERSGSISLARLFRERRKEKNTGFTLLYSGTMRL